MLFSELGRREVYLSKMLEHILQDVSSKLLFHGQATVKIFSLVIAGAVAIGDIAPEVKVGARPKPLSRG